MGSCGKKIDPPKWSNVGHWAPPPPPSCDKDDHHKKPGKKHHHKHHPEPVGCHR
ncbi:MAG: hypothetical protein QOG20_5581 [Pseudonocardiales bacterium]|jgi:hypothetical protein|uniref:hypothetical protein n=1 Tax=Pseudonocardia sp. TaxID=60912 RepID=UPI0026300891|nr:hypothetical protein [Pseudonocardia sp.]MCW2719007.1 hypothetical protein [Pseudonocardia sp.]MDT7615864.1 hypothetical protein [Pseudonocardiales bacterium]MDT7709974.1 hypothetical protein [Pseudonocardiales bacterium]